MVSLREIVLTLGILSAATTGFTAEPIQIARNPDLVKTSFSHLYEEEESIENLMEKPVEQILEGTGVKMYTHSNSALKELDRNVFNSNRPSLVLFYSTAEDDQYRLASKRMTLVFRDMAKEFKEDVDFHAYKADWSNTKSNNPYYALYEHYKNKGIGIMGSPSIAMFSTFDLLKAETPYRNNGRIKMLDILKDGPKEDKWVNPWVDWLKPWVKTNLTEPNSKYVIRMNNSSKESKISYSYTD